VTVTVTAPAGVCAGVVALIWVELVKLTPVAGVPPNVTARPEFTKLVPVITTAVSPAIGPALSMPSLTLVTVGAPTVHAALVHGITMIAPGNVSEQS